MSKLQAMIETEYQTDSYSGRGMFGDKCLGVVVKGPNGIGKLMSHIVAEIGNLVNENADNETVEETCDQIAEISDALHDMEWDSLGRDTIVYFRDVKYVSDEDDGDDDSDDVG